MFDFSVGNLSDHKTFHAFYQWWLYICISLQIQQKICRYRSADTDLTKKEFWQILLSKFFSFWQKNTGYFCFTIIFPWSSLLSSASCRVLGQFCTYEILLLFHTKTHFLKVYFSFSSTAENNPFSPSFLCPVLLFSASYSHYLHSPDVSPHLQRRLWRAGLGWE